MKDIKFNRFKNNSLIILYKLLDFEQDIKHPLSSIKSKKLTKCIQKITLNCILPEQVLYTRPDKICCLLKINSLQIVCGSYNSLISVWDLKMNNYIKSANLKGHKFCITSFVKISSDEIASSSRDCSIKIWDLTKQTCKKTLKEHNNDVECLILLNPQQLISGSLDKTIKLWDILQGTCLWTFGNGFAGSAGEVICLLKINSNFILSGHADNKSIKLWDFNNKIFVKVLKGHTGVVRCLTKLDKNKFLSGSEDNTIKLWNIYKGIRVNTYKGHKYAVLSIVILTYGRFLSGDTDGLLKIWDLDKATCLKTMNMGVLNETISIIKLNLVQVLVSGNVRNEIKLWTI